MRKLLRNKTEIILLAAGVVCSVLILGHYLFGDAPTEAVKTIRAGQNISAISRTDNVVSVTLSAAYPNNNLKPGQTMVVSGVTGDAGNFNGSFTIAQVNDQTHFTFNQTRGNATGTGGAAGGDYASLTGWVAGEQKDLVANNKIAVAECYNDWPSGLEDNADISGFTTDATRYVKITVPKSERHSGLAGTGFALNPVGSTAAITLGSSYTVLEWFAIKDWGASGSAASAVVVSGTDCTVRYCLIHDEAAGNGGKAIVPGSGAKIYNNFIYNVKNGIYDTNGSIPVKVYNNTVYNCSGTGIGKVLTFNAGLDVRNNIAMSCGTDFTNTTYFANSGYNLASGIYAPGANNQLSMSAANQFVSILEGAEDLHLKTGSNAINTGGDLSSASLFSDDLDTQSRVGAWDIGADEIYVEFICTIKSSGGDYTSLAGWENALAPGGASGDLDLTSASTLVFAVTSVTGITHTEDGMEVTGSTSAASGKLVALNVAGTQALIKSISGIFQNGEIIYLTQNSLKKFTLADTGAPAIATAECYALADNTAVTIDGWVTGPENYIRVYTPTTSRHTGIWNDSKYKLEVTATANNTSLINIKENYARIEGLQLQLTNSGGKTGCAAVNITAQTTASDIRINNNIIKGTISGTSSAGIGISADDAEITAKIYNNIIYGFLNNTTANNVGIKTATGGTFYLSNNTVYGNYEGINAGSGTTVIAKNNLVNGNSADSIDYLGSFASGSVNNISKDTSSPNSGLRIKAVTFKDEPGLDLHLGILDTYAKAKGVNLAADSSLSFTSDIDGENRSLISNWDIGADEIGLIWTGASGDSKWSTPGNWDKGRVPEKGNSVVVDYTSANFEKVWVYNGATYEDKTTPATDTLPSASFGSTWTDLGQQFSQTGIYSLAYLGNGICLAGANGKILRSIDYGSTWTDLGQQFSQTQIRSLAYLGNGICLAGTGVNGKILRSTDYGSTWSDLGTQFSQTGILSLTYLGNGICLAGTYPTGRILRSTDYGATWSDLGQQFGKTYIYSLAYVGNGICLAGTYSGGRILRSTDYGATWSDLGTQFSETYLMSLAYVGNGICLAGTSPGGKILRSIDYGATWSDLGQQFSQTEIDSFAYLGNGICLAGAYPNGRILRSTDYGATWSDLGTQFSQTYIFSLAYLGNGITLAGTSSSSGRILRSPLGDVLHSGRGAMIKTSGDILYIGRSNKFSAVYFDLSAVRSGGDLAWEYYNGSTWASLTTTDTTVKLSKSGYIQFTIPTDWAVTSVNSATYYYIRARATSTMTSGPTGNTLLQSYINVDSSANNLGSITTDAPSYLYFDANSIASGMSMTVSEAITLNKGGLAFKGDLSRDSDSQTPANEGTGWTIIAKSISIADGAIFDTDSLGFGRYVGYGGPGAGGSGSLGYGAGAGYGGPGGASSDGGTAGAVYGTNTNPYYLGSNGGGDSGGPGGGALTLTLSDTLTAAGILSANGKNASTGSPYGGGGAGGSLKIATNVLTGAGRIMANGGTGAGDGTSGGGGGGAGRIYLCVNTNNFTGSIETKGAAAGGTNAQAGADNTKYETSAAFIINSPNGGETWVGGSVHNITWTALGSVGTTANLKLSTDGGLTYPYTITASTPISAGFYRWTTTKKPTTTARVRITSNQYSGVSDASNNNFTITGLEITSPNGGENLEVGATDKHITWNSSAAVGNGLTIEYTINNGASWIGIDSAQTNDGDYAGSGWNPIPNKTTTNPVATKVRIYKGSAPFDAAYINDESDASFNIVPIPALTVIAPNGAEQWPAHNLQNITWSVNSTASNSLKIEYSNTGDFNTHTAIVAASVPNTGTYIWNVPDDLSTTVKVRITDNNRSTCTDASDANFSIINPQLTVTAPNGNEVWAYGDTEYITWTGKGEPIQDLLFEYSKDDFGSDLHTINPSSGTRSDMKLRLPFEEGIGTTAADASGGANNATLYNDLAWSSGRFGKGLSFDGVNDYAKILHSAAISPDTRLSLKLQLLPDTDVKNSYLVDKKGAYYLRLLDNRVYFGLHKLLSLVTSKAINDVYCYEAAKDTIATTWRADAAKTWYQEAKNTAIRGSKSEFPQKAILVAVDTYLYIYDGADNTLWMRFDVTSTSQIPAAVKSVFALNGKVYCATASGLFEIDFTVDKAYLYTASGRTTSDKDIANRNGTNTYSSANASLAIASSVCNDVSAAVINQKTFVAVANNANAKGGISLINETDTSVANLGSAAKAYNKVTVTSTGQVYGLNTTDLQVDAWYTADTLTGDNKPANYFYDETTTPALTTLTPAALNDLYVTTATSVIDTTSNTLYVAGDFGLSVIQEKRGDEASGSVKYYTKDNISEELIGAIASDWSMDQTVFKVLGYEATGKFSQAVRFSGSSDQTQADSLTLERGASQGGQTYEQISGYQGTISFWFNPTWAGTDGKTHYFFHNPASPNSIKIYKTTSNNEIKFECAGQSAVYSGTTITAGAWFNVVCRWASNTLDGTKTLDIRVNNGTAGSTSNALTTSEPAAISYIASNSAKQYSCEALLDDFCIWRSALAEGDIAALYNSGAGTSANTVSPEYISFYSAMDGTGALANNLSGFGTYANPAENKLVDGNMEAAGVASWPSYGSPTAKAKDAGVYKFGGQSLKLTGRPNYLDGFYQTVSGLTSGDDYLFRAWTKNTLGAVGFNLKSGAEELVNDYAYSTDWQEYETSVEVPDGQTSLALAFKTSPAYLILPFNKTTVGINGADGQVGTFTPGFGFRPLDPTNLTAYNGILLTQKDNLQYARGDNVSGVVYKNFDPNQGTLEFWVKPNWNGGDGVEHYIFSWVSGNNYIYLEKYNSLGRLYLQVGFGGVDRSAYVDASSWTAGNWYHVVGTWDRRNTVDGTNYLKIYWNAVNTAGNTNALGAVGAVSNTFFIGSSPGNLALFNGAIAGRILSRPLSAMEVTNLYNSGAGSTDSFMVDEDTVALLWYDDQTNLTDSSQPSLVSYPVSEGSASKKAVSAITQGATEATLTTEAGSDTAFVDNDAVTVYDGTGFQKTGYVDGAPTSTQVKVDNGSGAIVTDVEKVGAYATLDGSTKYFNGGNVLNVGSNDFSISFWVRSTTSHTGTIVSKIGWTGSKALGYSMILSGSYFIVQVNGDSSTGSVYWYNAPGAEFYNGAWHHIAVTFDRDANATLYYDGVSKGTQSIAAGIGDTTYDSNFLVGRNYLSPVYYFNGSVRDVRIWTNGIWSASEIIAQATNPHNISVGGTNTASWYFDDATSATTISSQTGSYPLSLVGGTTTNYGTHSRTQSAFLTKGFGFTDWNMEQTGVGFWALSGTPTTLSKDTTTVKYDTQSLHIKPTADKSEGAGQTIPATAGDDFLFSAYLKNAASTGSSANIMLSSGATTLADLTTASTDWTRVESCVEVPATESTLTAYFRGISGDSLGYHPLLDLQFSKAATGINGKDGEVGTFTPAFGFSPLAPANLTAYNGIRITQKDNLQYARGDNVTGVIYKNFDPNQGTLEFWVKPNWNGGDGVTHYVFDDWAGSRISLVKIGNLLDFRMSPSFEATIPVNSSNFAAGTWHHIIAIWNINGPVSGTKYLTLYLDNIEATSITSGALSPLALETHFHIGEAGATSHDFQFSGLITGRILNRPISATEVTALYNSGAGSTDSFTADEDTVALLWYDDQTTLTASDQPSLISYPVSEGSASKKAVSAISQGSTEATLTTEAGSDTVFVDNDPVTVYDTTGYQKTGYVDGTATSTQVKVDNGSGAIVTDVEKVGRNLDLDALYYAQAANNTVHDITMQDISISAWVKVDVDAPTMSEFVVKRGVSSGADYAISYVSTGVLRMAIYDGTDQYYVQGNINLRDNKWHYVAGVIDRNDGTNCKIFIDGVENSITKSGTLANVDSLTSTGLFSIGYTASKFDGQIRDVKLYYAADDHWTDAQIQYQATHPFDYTASAGTFTDYWKCDEGSGTTITGKPSTGYNLTLSNAAAWSTEALLTKGFGFTDWNMEQTGVGFWALSGTPTTLSKDTTTVKYDTQSLHIKPTADKSEGAGQTIPATAGDDFLFSAYLKNAASTGSSANILLSSGATTLADLTTASTDWARVESCVEVPATESTLTAYFRGISGDSLGYHPLLDVSFSKAATGINGKDGEVGTFTPAFGFSPLAPTNLTAYNGIRITQKDNLQYSRGDNVSGVVYKNFDPNQGTLEFWVKPNWNGGDGVGHHIFDARSDANNQIQFYKNTANNLILEVKGAGTSQTASVSISAWTAGTWYHLVAVWDKNNDVNGTNNLYVYVNASGAGNTTAPTALASAPSNFQVGQDYSLANSFNGTIAGRILNRPLRNTSGTASNSAGASTVTVSTATGLQVNDGFQYPSEATVYTITAINGTTLTLSSAVTNAHSNAAFTAGEVTNLYNNGAGSTDSFTADEDTVALLWYDDQTTLTDSGQPSLVSWPQLVYKETIVSSAIDTALNMVTVANGAKYAAGDKIFLYEIGSGAAKFEAATVSSVSNNILNLSTDIIGPYNTTNTTVELFYDASGSGNLANYIANGDMENGTVGWSSNDSARVPVNSNSTTVKYDTSAVKINWNYR